MNLYLRLLLLRLRALRQARAGIWHPVVTPFRVLPTDLDLLGHMNNGRYLTLMDLGRVDLMLRSGLWSVFRRQGWYPVVAGQTITYRRSLRPGRRFELHTRLLGFHGPWVYLEQVFCVGEEVHAEAVVRGRFLRRSGGVVSEAELEAAAGEPLGHHGVPGWMVTWTDATKPRSQYPPRG